MIMELEITGKRKKDQQRKLWEECVKTDLVWCGLRKEDVYNQEKWQEKIKAKTASTSQHQPAGIMALK